jgi:hypothetical protein
MSFNLGRAPERFTVTLVENADFIAALRRANGEDWPGTLQVSLVFNDTDETTWTATINGPQLLWNVDKVESDAVFAARPKKVTLWYVDGDVEISWAQGTVVYLRATS